MRTKQNNNLLPSASAPSAITGFTLIELMIVIAIIGLLTMIALPSYQNSKLRTNRADGKAALMQAAALQESYYSANSAYLAQANPLSSPLVAEVDSPDGKYKVTVAACTGGAISNCFIATATPQGEQVNDVCSNLTLTNIGVRSSSAGDAADCWQR